VKAGFFVQLEKSLGGFTSGLEKVASTFDEGKLATTCTETVSFESWQVHNSENRLNRRFSATINGI